MLAELQPEEAFLPRPSQGEKGTLPKPVQAAVAEDEELSSAVIKGEVSCFVSFFWGYKCGAAVLCLCCVCRVSLGLDQCRKKCRKN